MDYASERKSCLTQFYITALCSIVGPLTRRKISFRTHIFQKIVHFSARTRKRQPIYASEQTRSIARPRHSSERKYYNYVRFFSEITSEFLRFESRPFTAIPSLFFFFLSFLLGIRAVRPSTHFDRAHAEPCIPISQTHRLRKAVKPVCRRLTRYWEPLWFNRVNYDECMPAASLSRHWNVWKKIEYSISKGERSFNTHFRISL